MYVTRTIKHVKQELADNAAAEAMLRKEGRELLKVPAGKATKEQRVRMDAISAELDQLIATRVDLTKERAHFERLLDEERKMGTVGVSASAGPARGRRYVDLFGADTIGNDGWQSAAEFLSVVHAGLNDQRLRSVYMAGGLPQSMMAVATGTSGVDGGFSVPTEYVAQWLDTSIEDEIVRPRAMVWPMVSDTRHVPGWDANSATSTLFGGFTGNWVGQGDEITEKQPKMRAILLSAKKLAILTQVSNELLADGLGYDEQLSKAIVKAIGWFLDEAYLNGGGAGRPIGVLNASCTITVSKEVGQAADTIVYQNLTKMFARLHPASLKNSVWVASSTTIPWLTQLSIPIGTSGAHIPVMTQEDGQFIILTRPVLFTEKVPKLGDKGDIGLYDFTQYAIGLRQDMSLDKSQHAGFTRDTTYYRGLLRADGMPTWPSVYTPKNGDTLSPFVVLEAR